MQASDIIKAILIVVGFVFLYLLRDVLMVVFFAIMIASGVGPFATWLEGKRIPRLFGVLVLYIIFALLVAGLLALIVPFAVYEIRLLTEGPSNVLTGIGSSLQNIPGIQSALDSISNYLQFSPDSAVGLVVSVFGNILSFIAIIIISFYFSVMKQSIPSFFRSFLPARYEEYAVGLWRRAERKVGKWFQGQLLLSLAVGLVVFVGLSIMNVKYALVLGLIAMSLELIPIAGPVLAAIPAIVLAFMQSTGLGIGVTIFYVIIQQAENHILAPFILGKSTGLNPVTVILALLIGGKLGGILGILIAVPAAVVIVEVLDDMAETRKARLPM